MTLLYMLSIRSVDTSLCIYVYNIHVFIQNIYEDILPFEEVKL